MKKRSFSTELAYLLGLILLAFGTALMERTGFGMSMVVAPAYLFYLKLSPALPFFTFGMAEYTLQALLLLAMMLLLRSFRLSYLFSFITAVIYGFLLDGAMALCAALPAGGFLLQLVWYAVGFLLCALGVSFLFHTYISPEVYELFVKEVSQKYKVEIHRFKTAYDWVSCLIAMLLSFLFFGFGHFEGVRLGTVLCALLNGFVISRFSHLLEKCFTFTDTLPARAFFESK